VPSQSLIEKLSDDNKIESMTDSDKYRKATDMHNNSDEHLPPMNKNMEEDFNNKAVGLPSIAPSENN